MIIRDPDALRNIRAVRVLEEIGDAGALELLEQLSKGDPNAPLTKHAKGMATRAKEQLPRFLTGRPPSCVGRARRLLADVGRGDPGTALGGGRTQKKTDPPLRHEYDPEDNGVYGIAFAPDGKTLATQLARFAAAFREARDRGANESDTVMLDEF